AALRRCAAIRRWVGVWYRPQSALVEIVSTNACASCSRPSSIARLNCPSMASQSAAAPAGTAESSSKNVTPSLVAYLETPMRMLQSIIAYGGVCLLKEADLPAVAPCSPFLEVLWTLPRSCLAATLESEPAGSRAPTAMRADRCYGIPVRCRRRAKPP